MSFGFSWHRLWSLCRCISASLTFTFCFHGNKQRFSFYNTHNTRSPLCTFLCVEDREPKKKKINETLVRLILLCSNSLLLSCNTISSVSRKSLSIYSVQ